MNNAETMRVRELMWTLPPIERMSGLLMTIMALHQRDAVACEKGFLAVVEMLSKNASPQRRGGTIDRLRNLADRIEQPMLTTVN